MKEYGIYFVGLFFLVAIAFGVLGFFLDRKRREALEQLAKKLGLTFDPSPGSTHCEFESFDPFGKGSSRRSSNLLKGECNGIYCQIFDYRYSTGSGKNRKTHRCGIIAAKLPIRAPMLRIRPEGIFDKLVAMAGWDDINFESEEFSRKYHVSCKDRKFAYDVIHPGMIGFLMGQDAQFWQLGETWLVLSRTRRYRVEEIEPLIQNAKQFLELIPSFVATDYRRSVGGVSRL